MKKTQKIICLCLFLIVCLTCLSAIAKEGEVTEVYGKVVLVNSDNNYLNVESAGEKIAVLITTSTKIMYQNKELALKELNNGDVLKISGFYVDKSIIADGIEVMSKTAPKSEAVIYTIFHDGTSPIKVGDVLMVTMFGTPKGKASFDIGNKITGIEMKEVSAGKYEGYYTVKKGDVAEGAPVTGYIMMSDGTKTSSVAEKKVSFEKPVTKTSKLMPEEGSTTDVNQPNILIVIDNKLSKGLIPQTATLRVNGVDVTKNTSITEYVISYVPPQPMSDGTVKVEFDGVDYDGQRLFTEWTFNIKAQTAVQSELKINSVYHDASGVLEAGDVLNVTVLGTEGCKATFDIGSFRQDLPMTEIRGGVYTGSYTVTKNDKVQNEIIIGHLKSGNQKDTAVSSSGVSFNMAYVSEPVFMAPVITVPGDGATVSLPIVVTGKSTPGYNVEIMVSPKKASLFGVVTVVVEEDQTKTVVADKDGNFEATFQFSQNTDYTITAVTVKPNGEKSAKTVVKLVKNK